MTLIQVRSQPQVRRDRTGEKYTLPFITLSNKGLIFQGQYLRRGEVEEFLSSKQRVMLQIFMLRLDSGIFSAREDFITALWPNPDLEPEWGFKMVEVELCELRPKLRKLGCTIELRWGYGWRLCVH